MPVKSVPPGRYYRSGTPDRVSRGFVQKYFLPVVPVAPVATRAAQSVSSATGKLWHPWRNGFEAYPMTHRRSPTTARIDRERARVPEAAATADLFEDEAAGLEHAIQLLKRQEREKAK